MCGFPWCGTSHSVHPILGLVLRHYLPSSRAFPHETKWHLPEATWQMKAQHTECRNTLEIHLPGTLNFNTLLTGDIVIPQVLVPAKIPWSIMCQERKEVPTTRKSECHYLSGTSTRVCLVYLVSFSPSSKMVCIDQVWMLCKYLLRYSFPSTKSTAWKNFSSVIYLWLINFLNKI